MDAHCLLGTTVTGTPTKLEAASMLSDSSVSLVPGFRAIEPVKNVRRSGNRAGEILQQQSVGVNGLQHKAVIIGAHAKISET